MWHEKHQEFVYQDLVTYKAETANNFLKKLYF